jgi:hypothetical protein
MKKRIILVLLVLLIAGSAAIYLLRDKPVLQESKKTFITFFGIKSPEMSANDPVSFNLQEFMAGENKISDKESTDKMFQADERDNLVLNENTRINIEKLSLLYTRAELAEKLQKLSAELPPPAYRQVDNLINYYDQYTREVKQVYDPDEELSNKEELLEQLQGMHDLRVKHFGADVAAAFFGEEEKTARRLLEAMFSEKNKGMTMEERAEKAQNEMRQKH